MGGGGLKGPANFKIRDNAYSIVHLLSHESHGRRTSLAVANQCVGRLCQGCGLHFMRIGSGVSLEVQF